MPPAIPQADAREAVKPMDALTVHADISDLFFNRDLDLARVFDDGEFLGWNEESLRDYAETMLGSLERLGVAPLPTPEALVADFLSRC